MMIGSNDPRLTAYALGELEAAEAAAVEAELAGDAAAQAEVEAIRETAAVLRRALAAEAAPVLTPAQRQSIRARAARGPRALRFSPLRLVAWVGAAAAACVVVSTALRPALRRGAATTPVALGTSRIEPLGAGPGMAPVGEPSAGPADQVPGRPATPMPAAPAAGAPASPEAAPAMVGADAAVASKAEAGDGLAAVAGMAAARRSSAEGRMQARSKARPAGDDAEAGAEPGQGAFAVAMAAAGSAAPGLGGGPGAAAGAPGPGVALGMAGPAGGPAGGMVAAEAAGPPIPVPDADEASAPPEEPLPGEGPFVAATETPVSTIPLAPVDPAGYDTVHDALRRGGLPPPEQVRIEALVNHFSLTPGAPAEGRVQGPYVRAEVAACPWAPGQRLVRIALSGSLADDGGVPAPGAPKDLAKDLARTTGWETRVEAVFSPQRVASYRLLGYRDRGADSPAESPAPALRPGQTLTAFLQVVPAVPADTLAAVGATSMAGVAPRTRAARAADTVQNTDPLITVRLQWGGPGQADRQSVEVPVPDRPLPWAQASPEMQFGAAVALFGMLLRGSPYAGVASFDTVLDLASAPRTAAAEAQRGEFLDLVRRAKAVQATARQQ